MTARGSSASYNPRAFRYARVYAPSGDDGQARAARGRGRPGQVGGPPHARGGAGRAKDGQSVFRHERRRPRIDHFEFTQPLQLPGVGGQKQVGRRPFQDLIGQLVRRSEDRPDAHRRP